MKKVIFLFFISLSSFVVSQNLDKRTELMQVKWVLEESSIYELDGMAKSVINDNNYVPILTEIQFNQEYVTVEYNGKTETVEFQVNENWIFFNLIFHPFGAKWEVVDEKLILEWSQDIQDEHFDSLKTLVIKLTYNNK